MVCFFRYFTVCITYQPPLILQLKDEIGYNFKIYLLLYQFSFVTNQYKHQTNYKMPYSFTKVLVCTILEIDHVPSPTLL